MLKKSTIVKAVTIDAVRYELKYTKCNKKSCKNDNHGPYWYARYQKRPGAKWTWIYIGPNFKSLKEKFTELHEKRLAKNKVE